MTRWTLREAVPEDSAALLALTKQAPMRSGIDLQLERDPDFFALSRARGTPRVVVAEADGRLVGCAGVSRRRGRLGHEFHEIGVIADLKVHPDWRGRGLARALLGWLGDREADRPCVILATTAVGNTAVDRVAARFTVGNRMRVVADVTAWQLLPLPRGRAPAGLEVRAATGADLPALIALLDGFYTHHALAPPLADGGLEAWLARSPGMATGDFVVASRGGVLVAAVGHWNAETIKRNRIMGLPATLRALGSVSRGLARGLPVPHLPAVGDLLHLRFLRLPAHAPGHEDALRFLVREQARAARAAGEHFAVLGAPDGDPLRAIVRRMPRLGYRYRVVAGVSHPAAAPLLDRLEGARVYDDPSLT